MTIEELRTIELPATLECDDGFFGGYLSRVTIIAIGHDKLFIEDKDGIDNLLRIDMIEHYPSQKPEPRTVVFRQWMDDELRLSDYMVSTGGYYLDATKSYNFAKRFLKWVGEEHHIEVPENWRGEE